MLVSVRLSAHCHAVRVRNRPSSPPWLIVATAHPAKFESIVEPPIGSVLPVPESLRELLDQPVSFDEIDPEFEALREANA